MDEVDIDFSGGSHQVFKIGPASVAVPGTTLGLETAHRAFGTLPWAELVAPAAELARRGFELTRPQAYLHAILDLILRHSDEGGGSTATRASGSSPGTRCACPTSLERST